MSQHATSVSLIELYNPPSSATVGGAGKFGKQIKKALTFGRIAMRGRTA